MKLHNLTSSEQLQLSIGVILGILLLFQIYFIFSTFLLEPRVWLDEAYYADIALNILEHGRARTDIWGDMMPGANVHAMWYPPVFLYAVAGWFRLVGFSIEHQRLLSVIVGISFLIVLYSFVRLLIRRTVPASSRLASWLACTTVVAVAIDQSVANAMKISRPEIFALLFGTVSLYLLVQSYNSEHKRRAHIILITGSGLCAGLASLTHLVGFLFPIAIIFYLALTAADRRIHNQKLVFFSMSFALPVILWLLSILPDIRILQQQLLAIRERVTAVPESIPSVVRYGQANIRTIYMLYFLSSVIFLVFASFQRRRGYILLASVLVFSWLAPMRGHVNWYRVYLVPFVYGALALLTATVYSSFAAGHWKSFLLRTSVSLSFWKQVVSHRKAMIASLSVLLLTWIASVLAITTFLNVGDHISLLLDVRRGKSVYADYIESILQHVPEDATVYLTAVPNPYFGLKARSADTKLYQFPVVSAPRREYLNVLNDSDYVVYNGVYEALGFGDLLLDYLLENSLRTHTIRGADAYHVEVIELKPRYRRSMP